MQVQDSCFTDYQEHHIHLLMEEPVKIMQIFMIISLPSIDSNDLTRRSLINPSFAITLNSTVTGGIVSVSGQIKALEAINSENVTLYLAVTEKQNNNQTGAIGETKFYNVFRKFIPDAGGISLNKDLGKG